MKKLVLTAVASLACLAALAQGKVSFQNDSTRLAFWGPSAGALAGSAVNSDNLPAGVGGVVADLYLGTSSSSLFLYNTTTFSPLATGPGKILSASVQANASGVTGAPAIPGGTVVFVEVQIHDTSALSPNVFTGNGSAFKVFGVSPEFTFTLGTSVTYPTLWGAAGTWPVGTVNMDQYGVGARGSIVTAVVPEPASFALAGLGAAAMLIFRRRK